MSINSVGPGGQQPEFDPWNEPPNAEGFNPPPLEPKYAEPEEPDELDWADPNEPHDLAPVEDPNAGLLFPLGADNAREFAAPSQRKYEDSFSLGDEKDKGDRDTLSPNLSIGGQTVLSDEFEGQKREGQFEVGGVRIDATASLGESETLTGKYNLDEEGMRVGFSDVQLTGAKAEAKLEVGDFNARGSVEVGDKILKNGEARFDQDSVALTGGVERRVGVGATYGASWDPKGGPVSLGSTGEGFLGVRGKASGGLEADLTSGVSANVALEGFAGVEGRADATVALGDSAKAGVGVSAKAGIGATLKVDGEISKDRIGVELDIGATLGIGGNVRFDASIDPMGVIDDLQDVRERAEGKVEELKDAAQDKFNEVRDDVTEAAREKFDEVRDNVNEAKDAAGDMFNNAKDTIGGWFD